MSSEPQYSYYSSSILISEDYQGYEETLESLKEGLSEQTQEEQLGINEVRRNDDWIEVPSLHKEDQLAKVLRYKIDDDIEQKAVYIFDHHEGKEVIGDSSMVAYAGDLGLAPLMEDPLNK